MARYLITASYVGKGGFVEASAEVPAVIELPDDVKPSRQGAWKPMDEAAQAAFAAIGMKLPLVGKPPPAAEPGDEQLTLAQAAGARPRPAAGRKL